MTKAERIYRATRYECLRYVDRGMYEENPNGAAVGFNGLSCRDDETVSMRTINAVAKLLESAKRLVEMDVRLGVFSPEKAERERRILKMVESTLDNNRKSIERFNRELKAM
jgi:hypothetical protein